MSILKELGQPYEFWDYFEEISKIPRCSGNEDEIRVYIKNQADKLGFNTKVDKVGNLVVRIPSISKERHRIILQCHMDMVCEKNEATSHDFTKDPLKLKTININDEIWVTAEGTTLGADNGVGISYLLTLMKKIYKKDLEFESLSFELLFTVDEEVGLKGAFKIDTDLIEGDYLVNIDSEEDNAFTVGCAGGIVTIFNIKKEISDISQSEDRLIPIKIFITGLLGGHSGADIHLGRANALKIMSQILWKLNDKFPIHIVSIDGGNRNNAIPRESNAMLLIKRENFSEINTYIKELFKEIKIVFDGIEPKMEVIINKIENFIDNKVFSNNFQEKLLNILYLVPNGPHLMHPRIKDLVFTSTNFAILNTKNNLIEIIFHQRSMSEYFKYVNWERLKTLFKLSNFKTEIIIDSDYPGWTPDFDSKLLALSKDAYKKIFKKDVHIKAIHAGLECGILKKHFPKMEMISLGPNNKGAHSPDERLQVKSVERIWNFLINLFEKLD
ncbi:MAG: beta-Ala-His dipeptidase [Candidatus Hodarchaeota archaeon]